MSRILMFNDLDISFLPKGICADAYWKEYIALALRSRGESQRYGAIIVKNREVLGRGWNRLLGKGEPCPFRTSFFLHAEKDAMRDAILKHGADTVRNATLWVAGFFVKDCKPFILGNRITNTCESCTKRYVDFGLWAGFFSKNGRVRYCAQRAYENALENARLRKETGLNKEALRRELAQMEST